MCILFIIVIINYFVFNVQLSKLNYMYIIIMMMINFEFTDNFSS